VGSTEFVFTIDNIEKFQECCEQQKANKENPNSCEREPNKNEIKLSVKDFYSKYEYGIIGGDDEKCKQVSKSWFSAHINNFHYFVVSKSDFNYFEKKYNEWAEKERIFAKTVELNNAGIEFEKNGDISSAILVYEENIELRYPATHSYERLMILYRKMKDAENEIRVINIAIDVFSKYHNYRDIVAKYKNRLEKLTNTHAYSLILPNEAQPYITIEISLGKKYEQIIKNLPEFDFYNGNTCDFPNRHDEFITNPNQGKSIWNIKEKFKEMINSASSFESSGDLEKASKIYEKIIAEQYWLPTPYDRLIKIYSKAKLKSDEIRVLESSINYFSELRERQKEYVIRLAKKYNKLDFANEYINNGKKIYYYNGACELYNPYPIVEIWKERLQKCNREKSDKI